MLTYRIPLCEEAIRLGRLLLRLFPGESEIMGLTALMLLQHARASARLDANANIVLLDDQDRRLWDRALIAEGLVLVEKAQAAGNSPAPTSCKRPSPPRTPARHGHQDTDWSQIDQIYAVLEVLQPSPVVTLNRAVAVSKVREAVGGGAAKMLAPLAEPLAGYFHFFGVKGALLKELGRTRAKRRQAV